MYFNPVAILVATVVQFICGAVWYGPIFGGLWGRIHGFDKLSKEVQQKMMKEMGPFYAAQFGVTILTSAVLGLFIASLPQGWSVYGMAGFFWLGFTVPAQVSSVIFGGTPGEWIVKKIAVQAGGALVCLEAAAFVFHFFI